MVTASDYAHEHDIVFDTTNSTKSNITLALVGAGCHDMPAALQGGTPANIDKGVFLGVAEALEGRPAVCIICQIEQRGDRFGRNSCLKAASLGWPLVARKLYLQQAQSTVDMCLPLSLGFPMSATRLNALQVDGRRWCFLVAST